MKYKDNVSKANVEKILGHFSKRSTTAIHLRRVGFNGKANLVEMMVQYSWFMLFDIDIYVSEKVQNIFNFRYELFRS